MTTDNIYFPNTTIMLKPGDVLYSSKGWSTFLVGHVGMVGPDLRIYHSHPRGAFADSIAGYLSRHKFGGKMVVFRPKKGAVEAAEWVSKQIINVRKYVFHPNLDNIDFNYCSKFIWQAFWFTLEADITGINLSKRKVKWIFPYKLKRSTHFDKIAYVRL
ncbi:hypothetical protein [Aquibacillus kalidii]|uniref:hypothetical protein n=1 Tax=Aquibacillus kalidii TaxID=2762597 RepID=UPI00164876A1|nr:hypothetical protein [Aquibacillus kalidii]